MRVYTLLILGSFLFTACIEQNKELDKDVVFDAPEEEVAEVAEVARLLALHVGHYRQRYGVVSI